jgi:glutaredoxin
MQVKVFGIPTCSVCKSAREKLGYFIRKWGRGDQIPLTYYDLETVEGLAEGAYYEVWQVPTVVIEDEEGEVTRWVKKVPLSREFEPLLRRPRRKESASPEGQTQLRLY